MTFPKGGSERGGLSGPIAPPPHDVADVAHEQAWLAVATDPADVTSSPETVYAEWQKQVKPL